MVLAVTIGAVNQTAKMREGSGTLKFNTFDATFVDVATMPVVGNAVALTTPTWAGTVVSVKKRTGPRPGHTYVTVSATNTDTAGASAGPFGLSDTPNGATTYGYTNLEVETTHNLDGTDLTKGSLVLFTTGLWPAMTFALTNADLGYSATNFSVTDVTVTWQKGVPFYAMTFGDPLVTMSVWLNSESAGILPITRTKITDGEVTTPKLAANAVTADKLEAQLVLGTLIATPALTGARLELDGDGFRSYDSGDTQQVNIPTDGSAVQVTGELTANTLTATGTASFEGTNTLTKASVTTVAAGVLAPNAAPVLAKGWTQHTPATPTLSTYTSYKVFNGSYDSVGGAGGATPCYIAVVKFTKTGSTVYQVVEWKISDWSIDRQTTLTGLTMGAGFGSGSNMGVTRLGTSWYIATDDDGSTTSRVTKITRSTGAQSATATRATSSPNFVDIKNDATNLLVLDAANDVVQTWTTTPAFSASKTITGLPGGNESEALEYDGTNWWIVSNAFPASRVYKVTIATGAVVANSDFGLATTNGKWDLYWDGTVFHSGAGNAITFQITDHTSWNWTTASAIYWVGYAWYDQTGTTHETSIGTRGSITMDRRQQLQVSNQTIPVGGADDPDRVRIYMLPSASAPAPGTFKLQATDALTTRALTTYNSGGAADGGGTPFAGGVGGTLQSSDGAAWVFHGDGSTSFLVNSSSGFTISGGGSATYTGKLCEWISLGRLVVFALSFTVNASGSGGTGVTIASTTMPPASTSSGTATFTGDRSTSVPVRLEWRAANATDMDFASIQRIDTGATITGADLASTAVYVVTGAYIST